MFVRSHLWICLLAVGLLGAMCMFGLPVMAQDDGDDATAESDDQTAPPERDTTEWVLPTYEQSPHWLQHMWVSPDGRYVYYDQWRRLRGDEARRSYFSYGITTNVLDTETGIIADISNELRREIAAHNDVASVTFSPSGEYQLMTLWTRQYPETVTFIIREVETWEVTGVIRNGNAAWASWMGNRIAVTRLVEGKYGAIEVYNTRGRRTARTRIRGRVLASDDEGEILVLLADKDDPGRAIDRRTADVVVINARESEVLASLPCAPRQRTNVAYVSPEGNYVAVGRICFDYMADDVDYHLSVLSTDPENGESLTIHRRNDAIMRIAVTDEGGTIILTCGDYSGRSFTSLKVMDLQANSRVIVPYRAAGAVMHGQEVFCIVDDQTPYIAVSVPEMEGDMTGNEHAGS